MKIPRSLWLQVFSLVLLTAFFSGCASTGNAGSSGSSLTIANSSLPDATVSQPYSATLQATGGTAPYSWSVTAGSLPAGLNLSADGQLSGTPTTSGDYTFTATVKDFHMSSSSGQIHMKITGAPPSISGISPSSGSTGGGTSVTISGKNLQIGATVTFGGVAATSVKVVSSSQITAVTPAHAAGSVDVVVTNPNGKSDTLSSGFGYVGAAPTVSAITPNSGSTAGGTSVTITGNNFMAGALVFLGTVAASGVTINSSTQIQAITPSVSTAAAVNVVVQNSDGQSGTLTNGFTYTDPPSNSAPTVSSVSPGTVTAGTAVTVDGTNFGSGATVDVGSTSASNVQFLSSTQLSATVPSVSPGTYDVTVANTNGLSATLSGGLTVATPSSLLSGCTVKTSGTVGSTKNGSPAMSCATPSGWTLVSAENFSGGVLHASDETQLGGSGNIECTTVHSSGSCALQTTISGDGCSYCTWKLNAGVVPSPTTAVYLSFWQYEPGAVENWNGNFFLGQFLSADGKQGNLIDRWATQCNGTGPGNDYYCTTTQAMFSSGSNSSSGVNNAYYGDIYALGGGSWVQYEIYYQPNTATGGVANNDGQFEMYRNGILIDSTAVGSASGGPPTGDLNGTISMDGMSVQVGGYYMFHKVTDSTGTTCVDPANRPSGAVETASQFANAAPCPTHASFNRYFDDILVLAK